ncbi:uncharacterized protein LOC117229014 isoform X1 [Megalopta genalis]|uniref:uncharacterized protein LOC117229014 isoform X1 n=1 Tax=Megalopta genalis TaxID=115081 RepID=UPI003FD10520
MGKIVSSFHELSDQNLRSKMLRGAETCGKLWQQYKAVQEERLIRMRLTAKSRRKRHLKRDRRSRGSQSVWKRSNEKKNRKQSKELREALFAAEKIKQFQQSLMSKFTELEKKKHLNSEEQNELDRLHLTVTKKTRDDLEEYPLNEERTELTRLQEVGLCISRETARACESIVLDAVEKLI